MKLKFLLIILLPVGLCVQAQQYNIRSYAIAGGGGMSAGAPFSVNGAIGQPGAGVSTGGNYSVAGGFWPLPTMPAPGGPTLSIRPTATNTMVLTWPSSAVGFTVQQSSNLGAPIWIPLGAGTSLNGTNQLIIANPPAGSRYYRLVNQ